MKRAHEIVEHQALQFLKVDFVEELGGVIAAGGVDQDVDAAGLFERRGDGAIGRRRVGDVGLQESGVAAGRVAF